MAMYKDMTEAYPELIRDVLTNGRKSAPRGKPITEMLAYDFTLQSYEQPTPLQQSRKLNYKFAILEGLLNLAGECPPEVVTMVNRNMGAFVNPQTGKFDGAYPPRFALALRQAYERLRQDPDTRQAIIPIFNSADAQMKTSLDYPCTISLQFLIRDNKLNLIVTMRSNDILLGLPYDVSQFAIVGKAMAGWLGIETGWYKHQAGSFHSYDEREPQLRAVLEANDSHTEKYADFKHPKWDMDYESSMTCLQYLLSDLKERARAGNLLLTSLSKFTKDPFFTYNDYLTGATKVNFV